MVVYWMLVLLPMFYDDAHAHAHGHQPIVVHSVFVLGALDVDHAVAWRPYFHQLAYYEPKNDFQITRKRTRKYTQK